jgi:hypothetical protein
MDRAVREFAPNTTVSPAAEAAACHGFCGNPSFSERQPEGQR